jgi:hypothetical protein
MPVMKKYVFWVRPANDASHRYRSWNSLERTHVVDLGVWVRVSLCIVQRVLLMMVISSREYMIPK